MDIVDFLKKHEKEVDKVVIKIFKFLLGLIFINYLTVIIINGEFTIQNEKIIFYSIWIFILIPIIYYKRFGGKFKNISIGFSLIISFMIYVTSGLMAAFIWVIPIALACLYADYELVKKTFIYTIPLLIVGHMLQPLLYPDYVIESKLSVATSFTIYFLLQFIAIGIIFSKSTKRVNDMLFESAKMNETNSIMLNKSLASSRKLSQDVEFLNDKVKKSNEEVGDISEYIQSIKNDSKGFVNNIFYADKLVEEIAINIDSAYTRINNMSEQTSTMSNVSINNKNNLLKSIEEIYDIEESTSMSKEAVMTLVKRAGQIRETTSVINNISKKTNLLALNASIEAARAGEKGKGFSVVAENIKELAFQSEQSSIYIEEILDIISNDINKAVTAIENTNEMVTANINFTKSTVASFDQMFNMQKNMISELNTYSKSITNLNESGNNIKNTMSSINCMNNNNYEKITNISASIDELNTNFNEISRYVQNINNEAKQLASID